MKDVDVKSIVIVSCVAPPETVVSGRVNWDIALNLASKGYSVTFVCPKPSRPLDKFRDYEIGNYDQIIEGVRRIYVDSFIYPDRGVLGRIIESFSFGYKSVYIVNRLGMTIDLVYCMPWPFLGQLIFISLFKKRSSKIIINVQDLYPESWLLKLRGLGKLFNFLKIIDRFIVKSSDHVTVVSNSLKSFYVENRKLEAQRITVIENWQDEEAFLGFKKKPVPRSTLLKEYNLECVKSKFVFMYLGNIGPVAGLESVIRAVKSLENAILIVAGSGTAKSSCEFLVAREKIRNVLFLDVPPGLRSVVELQSLADVMVLPIKSGAASTAIPSKLIAYMFSSKPVASSADVNSFTAQAIEDSNCGWLLSDFKNWEDMLKNICNSDPKEIISKGNNAFDYSLRNYSKEQGLIKVNNLLKKII